MEARIEFPGRTSSFGNGSAVRGTCVEDGVFARHPWFFPGAILSGTSRHRKLLHRRVKHL